ncbi:sigma-54-dependent transcriptional regulator [Tindallia californiensis]|uniref:Stage 0 sporulation protein A homolog n=1 Tax=Tindallia californiensis TaxID=159292 RepID=A0A1H3LDL7_9FIRM|nr:sigma-54 dependent transcriptional regulator [Tindallia californiensis]SDY62416.1 two component, sigma54 specific, transcriptional regulator, Fis family [Tindallia californiensis]
MALEILIIDDEETLRMSLVEGLKDMGHNVYAASDGKTGMEAIESKGPQAVMLDIRLPDANGLQLIQSIKAIDESIQIIIMTAYGDIRTAVSAIKQGAFDYIHKPFDLDEIQVILKRIEETLRMKQKLFLLEKESDALIRQPIIGQHPSMSDVFHKIEVLSKNDDVTVLIRGETGTGKELVASAIHHASSRKNAPLVSINCAALSQNLIESELFGHEKNAFTGANALKKGLIEIADGGSVFLDEIGELKPDTQTKFLRVLEDKKMKRVGGLEDIQVDVRIIAATNKDLEKAIEEKEFREDLYYRLNVVPVCLPPLRERGEDILLIARHFLTLYNQKFHKQIEGFTKEAEKCLLDYPWKGNIRELKNVVERMVILHTGKTIDEKALPSDIGENNKKTPKEKKHWMMEETEIPEGFSLEEHLKEIEACYLNHALEKCHHNHTQAAELLGISRFALKRRTEKRKK